MQLEWRSTTIDNVVVTRGGEKTVPGRRGLPAMFVTHHSSHVKTFFMLKNRRCSLDRRSVHDDDCDVLLSYRRMNC